MENMKYEVGLSVYILLEGYTKWINTFFFIYEGLNYTVVEKESWYAIKLLR